MEKQKKIQKYIVGGYVRDSLLGLEINDRDFVVTNSSPEEMLSLGFEQVGESFPVFLHPETREEYALARKEYSTGLKSIDFKFETQNVTLKDDLFRRDLTINAMAFDSDGKLIDFFNGKNDLENKIIRHVSDSFKDDPLRVLRVARFAARFNDFKISDETIILIKDMVIRGALKNIPNERISIEIFKAIKNKNSWKFFKILKDINALKDIETLNLDDDNIETLKNNKDLLNYHVLILLFLMNAKKCKLTFINNSLIGQKLFKLQEIIYSLVDFIYNKNIKSFNKINSNLGRELLVNQDFLKICDILDKSLIQKIYLIEFEIIKLNKFLSEYTTNKENIVQFKNEYINKFILTKF